MVGGANSAGQGHVLARFARRVVVLVGATTSAPHVDVPRRTGAITNIDLHLAPRSPRSAATGTSRWSLCGPRRATGRDPGPRCSSSSAPSPAPTGSTAWSSASPRVPGRRSRPGRVRRAAREEREPLPARDEPPRRVRGGRRPGPVGQAGGVGRRRRLDRGPVLHHASTSRCEADVNEASSICSPACPCSSSSAPSSDLAGGAGRVAGPPGGVERWWRAIRRRGSSCWSRASSRSGATWRRRRAGGYGRRARGLGRGGALRPRGQPAHRHRQPRRAGCSGWRTRP